MSFSFNPLWKLLIDKGITREEMRKALKISPSTMAKMSRGENVSMDVLNRICQYFGVQLNDVVEHIKEKE